MRKRKVYAAAMAAVMAASVLAGCGSDVESTKDTTTKAAAETKAEGTEESEKEAEEFSYPMETDVTLNMFAGSFFGLADTETDYHNSPFWQEMTKRLGITIDMEYVPVGGDPKQQLNLILADPQNMPVLVGNIPITDAEQYINDGAILDLSPYLEQYAPNYWAMLNDPENEEIRRALTTDSGKIGVFGSWRESDWAKNFRGMMVRKDILDKEGLEIPVTIADWEEVLTVMKEKYDLQFTAEFNIFNQGPAFASGFGAYNTCWSTMYVEDGTIYNSHMQPEWRELITTMNKWYEAGLIDPDLLTNTDEEVTTKVYNDKAGVVFGPLSRVTRYVNNAEKTENGQEWYGVPYPVVKEGEKACAIQFETATRDIGVSIAASASEEEIIAACRAMDYFYSEEGIEFANFGTEGVSYTLDEEGNHIFTDLLKNDPDGFDMALKKYATASGINVGIQLTEYVKNKNHPVGVEAVDNWTSNQEAAEHYYPSVSFTDDELREKTSIESAISTYIQEATMKFIIGDMDIETEYDSFIETLKDMQMERLIEIYQTAYDRYMAR
ncbi:sugar ABC transporter substrate-binding protein [Lachnospiraceae bacterium]|nr:sugar ABC transporter substrate-binding protein [Lachnospiraceae bacterium]GKH41834.1 sugar ABC transporter substrate-binding protein [Lachnospiraceae bacterium]GKH54461.1 sugar ABC transporter substrate-binding protein [Lachnospiraceae bacterium]